MAKPMIQFDDFSTPAKVMMMLYGYGGGGKSFTAYQIASQISNGTEFPVIDTEKGSARKYRKQFPNMRPIVLDNYSTENYDAALDLALTLNPSVIVIDSMSHEWASVGGVIDKVAELEKRKGSSFSNWKEPKDAHAKFLSRLQSIPQHVIVTVRAKDKVAQSKNAEGKTIMTKLTAQKIQDKELDFDFDLVIRAEKAGKRMTVTKSRAHGFIAVDTVFEYDKINGTPLVSILSEWLESQTNG